MADKSYPMTAEGKKKLENELEELKTKKRPEVIERIKVARGFGDLSENSEYEAAKDEQSTLENRIVTIQTMLRYAEIIDAAEADAFNGKISNESPIAQGLIGRKVGDQVTINTPGGEMTVKITKVEG